MNIAKLHLQQAQQTIDSMTARGILAYAVGTLNNLFIIKGHKPNCKCMSCPVYRENGEFV